jgi:hypothetical protein
VPVVLRSEKQHGAESKMHRAWMGDVSTKEMNATLRSGYNLPKQTKKQKDCAADQLVGPNRQGRLH